MTRLKLNFMRLSAEGITLQVYPRIVELVTDTKECRFNVVLVYCLRFVTGTLAASYSDYVF